MHSLFDVALMNLLLDQEAGDCLHMDWRFQLYSL